MPAVALTLLAGLLGLLALEETRVDVEPPTRDYYAYVCAESEDEVYLVRFGPGGVAIDETIQVGSFPAEIEGPHGVNVSPAGDFWYVSISHGQPFGSIHKYSTATNEWEESADVGMFPATLDVSRSTGLLYVVNSDFYGDHVTSTISVVETQTMTEVAQVPSGVMPHGARLSSDGKLLYSVNMMSDELIELDALRFEIKRRLPLGGAAANEGGAHAGHAGHGDGAMVMQIEPSWVSKPTADGKVYVTGLSAAKVFEVDLAAWRVVRTFETPPGPYNVAITPDGTTMVVTYKKSDAVGIWDLASGQETARIETTRRIPHGVAITGDGRYGFVTVEGVGGEPGVVEIVDLRAGQRVGTLEVGKQAGGVAVWER